VKSRIGLRSARNQKKKIHFLFAGRNGNGRNRRRRRRNIMSAAVTTIYYAITVIIIIPYTGIGICRYLYNTYKHRCVSVGRWEEAAVVRPERRRELTASIVTRVTQSRAPHAHETGPPPGLLHLTAPPQPRLSFRHNRGHRIYRTLL